MQFSEKLEEGFKSFYNCTVDRWSREIHKLVAPYTTDVKAETLSRTVDTPANSAEKSREEEWKIQLLALAERFFRREEKNENKPDTVNDCNENAVASYNEVEVDAVLESLNFENEDEKENFRSKMVSINQVFHSELEEIRRQHRRLKAEQMLRVYFNNATKDEEPTEGLLEYLFKTLTHNNSKFRIDSKVCRKIVEELLLMDELERVLLSLEKQSIELDHLICDLEIEVHDRILAACKPRMKGLSSSADSFTKRMHDEGGLKYINHKEEETLLAYSSLPPPLSRENLQFLRQLHRESHAILQSSNSFDQARLSRLSSLNFERLPAADFDQEANTTKPTLQVDRAQGETLFTAKEVAQKLSLDDPSPSYAGNAMENTSSKLNYTLGDDEKDVAFREDGDTSNTRKLSQEQHARSQLRRAKLLYMLDRDSGISLTLDEPTTENGLAGCDSDECICSVLATDLKKEEGKCWTELEVVHCPCLPNCKYCCERINEGKQPSHSMSLQAKPSILESRDNALQKVNESGDTGSRSKDPALDNIGDMLGLKYPKAEDIEADRKPVI